MFDKYNEHNWLKTMSFEKVLVSRLKTIHPGDFSVIKGKKEKERTSDKKTD